MTRLPSSPPLRAANEPVDTYRALLRLGFLRAVDEIAPHVVRELEGIGIHDHCYSELLDWAARHHLEESWILDFAVVYLRLAEGSKEPQPFAAVGIVSFAFWDPASQVPPPSYHPDFETRAQYNARLEPYLEAVEASYRRAGWSDAPEDRELPKHLRMLVAHQVCGLTYAQTAEKIGLGMEQTAARKAIKRLARLLPLTLRPAPHRR